MAKEITEWAKGNENVRAVILTSTRTNPNASADELSDYDIELFVRDIEPFSDPDEWMSTFGQIMVRHPKWTMVYYLDGPKVDFGIMTVEELEKEVNTPVLAESYDIGYEILLDKDGLTKSLKAPTYNAYQTKPPTESEYKELVHRFWFNIMSVAKGLYRDQLFYAKGLGVGLHQTSLKTALSWYIGMKNGWKTNPGVCGKFFKKQLDPKTWFEVEETFAGSNLRENWEALFQLAALFGKLTSEVGEYLGYAYPVEVERHVTEYLRKIKNMSEK